MVNTLFEQFKRLNIMIVGDVMLDRYLAGQVNRISPEAPVPVVHLSTTNNRLGGAANVALNIAAFGATAYVCSVIGEDQNAIILKNLLAERKINTTGIVQTTTRPTTIKTRILARHQQLLRFDEEVTHDITPKEEAQLIKKFIRILETTRIDAIIFQDYNKGVLTPNLIKELIQYAQNYKIPTIVDPKKNNFFAFKNTTLFKPNLKEVIEGTGLQVDPISKASLRNCAKLLRAKMGIPYILITLSENGIYIDTESDGQIIPTEPRNIADVCGAGDTVISTTALGVAANMAIQEAALLANLAGGIVCESVGVVPIDIKRLQAEYLRLQSK